MIHPDRELRTLARRDGAAASRHSEGPGPGAADARIDVKLLLHRVRQALAERGTDAARARFAAIDSPHLLGGTIQDGVARGIAVALDETLDLCEPPAHSTEEHDDAEAIHTQTWQGRQLRRKKDLLVASASARIRFSRKGGVLLVDRDRDLNAEDCIRFEDRRDQGDLDGFAAVPGDRPRLFSPAFLAPHLYVQGPERTELRLSGRLGRSPAGYPCAIAFSARSAQPGIRMTIRIDNRHDDHRLRLRLLGIPAGAVRHECTDVWETVQAGSRTFRAATLVRSVGRLRVGERNVAVPEAQCHRSLTHTFWIGDTREA